MPDELKSWNYDSSIPGTFQAFIYSLKMKYGVTKKYVTLEAPSSRLLTYLAQTYKVKTAGYTGLTGGDQEEVGAPQYSHLVVQDPRIDAFYYDVMGTYPKVVVFFDDPMELNNLRARAQEIMEVPFGCYQLQPTMQGYILSPVAIKSTERPILDHDLINSLLTDTETFFSSREFYKANRITHKRGILMFGGPGQGKTSYIKYYLGQLVDKYGIIIDCSQVSFGPGLFHYLKAMLGSKPKVIVLEDVDGVAANYGDRSAFLNFLDGPRELDNTLTVATTNFPERLDDAILDRPSRFDALYHVGLPGPELRREFLLKWFKDLEGERLAALVVATDGLSGAFFTELFTITGLRQCSVEQALTIIQDRKKMIDEFRHTHDKAGWGKEVPKLTAGLALDYRIDLDLARRIVAASKKA